MRHTHALKPRRVVVSVYIGNFAVKISGKACAQQVTYFDDTAPAQCCPEHGFMTGPAKCLREFD